MKHYIVNGYLWVCADDRAFLSQFDQVDQRLVIEFPFELTGKLIDSLMPAFGGNRVVFLNPVSVVGKVVKDKDEKYKISDVVSVKFLEAFGTPEKIYNFEKDLEI